MLPKEPRFEQLAIKDHHHQTYLGLEPGPKNRKAGKCRGGQLGAVKKRFVFKAELRCSMDR